MQIFCCSFVKKKEVCVMFFGFYVFHMFCIFIITIEPNRIQTRLATQNDRLNLLKDIHLVDTKK